MALTHTLAGQYIMLGKADLLEVIAPLNRGIRATPADRLTVEAAAVRLEERNPSPQPLSHPAQMEGNWRLLYTTSQELLNLDRLPLASLGPIYQCIRLGENRIYNIAEVNGPPLLSGLVTVAARLEPVSERRVNVRFERGIFGLQGRLGYQSPNQFIAALTATPRFSLLQGLDFSINAERQAGWLDITYLDADLRIGRGNQGNLFILSREP
ncbi:MAG: PAP/fibrillin family protein [Leptolyngbya sp.]|nr:PAP/fibrillin family protein [Leptolyngbya sp.]